MGTDKTSSGNGCQLEFATAEELYKEVERRNVSALIVILQPADTKESEETLRFRFSGGAISALGMAVAAREYLLKVLSGEESEENDG